jgi:hypothetical protein
VIRIDDLAAIKKNRLNERSGGYPRLKLPHVAA